MKKILLGLLLLVVLAAAGAGVAWQLNGERWQQEYAAWKAKQQAEQENKA